MNKPLISIVIPCYNHGQYIDEAINSIEEYKEDNYEIIIINDGSTDFFTNTRLLELKNNGYNVIFQENQGLGKTRNNGIRIARGKYILPLDADNKIKPEFIIKALEILEADSKISIVYSDRQLFGNSNQLINVGNFTLSQMIRANYIDACAVYRKDVWIANNGYDEKMPIQGWEDWDFWLSSVERNFQFYYIPQPLFLYRVVQNSMIHHLNHHPDLKILIEYVYRKHIALILNEFNKINTELSIFNFEKAHPFRTSLKYMIKFLTLRKN